MLQDVKSYLGRCFAMKDLGEAAYILGIKIYKDRSRRLIGASTPAEVKRMQNVPYASAVILNEISGFLATLFIFATSSAKAEYIAASDASKEAVSARKIISELGVTLSCQIYYLREVIEFGDIKLEKAHTDDNLADPFTKALLFPKHSEHTKNIGMLSASSLM
ncbi:hypothetical protein Tco_1201223 [Tanacetum coccineum]